MSGPRRTLAATLLLALGIAALVGLQLRWIVRLEEAELGQMRRLLQLATERIAAGLELRAQREAREPGFDDVARAALVHEVLPELARDALGEAALAEHGFAILAAHGDEVLYRSLPATEFRPEDAPDAEVGVFAPAAHWLGAPSAGEAEVVLPLAAGAAPWRLLVRHRQGSLALLARDGRVRNLALGAGVVALLVAACAWSLAAERRARRLALKELAFVAGVSHELRTPLAVIRTAASNLECGIVETERVAEYARLIEHEVRRMQATVEQVLRFAPAQRHAPARAALGVRAWIEEAVQRARQRNPERACTFALEVEPELAGFQADRAMLLAALVNLLENAMRYGPAGQTVRVRAAREGEMLVLEVHDQGEGIAARERTRVFEPFFRGAAARRGSVPGSGLGLAIARQAVAAHGGEVSAEPSPRGALLRLRLPLEGAS